MLDKNLYKYAYVQEYEYADVHEYEYANVYEYELVETQTIKNRKEKKTFSTGRYHRPLLNGSICCACVACTLVPGGLTGTK